MDEKYSSVSASSLPSNPCPICLQPVNQEAYLDRCFHNFCYGCIARWSKWVARQMHHSNSTLQCPLCKVENFSIIHDCDGYSFQQHYINQDVKTGFSISEAHRYRLQCYYSAQASVVSDKFDIAKYWRSHKYLQPNRWFQSWLRREIEALVQEEDVDIIVHHILGVIESFLRSNERERFKANADKKQEEFQALVSDAARPFMLERTDRFVNEMELFLASGLNIEAYDEVYRQCLHLHTQGTAEERTSDQPSPVLDLDLFLEESDSFD